MATKTVCDFCGDESDHFHRIRMDQSTGNPQPDWINKDLCGNCWNKILEFITSLKKV